MAHCYICDYNETARSDLYCSLVDTEETGNRVLFDSKINNYVCTHCLNVSLSNYRSLGGERKDTDDIEEDFDIPVAGE